MTSQFSVQGFGVLSQWNGDFASSSMTSGVNSIAATGANSIELVPRLWTSTDTSNVVFADAGKSESDASLIAGIRTAHAAGLSVFLKPSVSGLDGAQSYQLDPTDPGGFFASYKATIVHLATLAQQEHVESLSIGNELGCLSGILYLPYWTDIVRAVRAVYSGDITYAAAMDEAARVSFWGQVDTVGVNMYPPLSTSTTPSVAELMQAWQSPLKDGYYKQSIDGLSPIDFLKSLATAYGKQVLITEVGYRSIDAAAADPGRWDTVAPQNDQAQANAYEAFARVAATQGGSWLKGVEFWSWDIDHNSDDPTSYPVQGKPALGVAETLFGGGYASDTNPLVTMTHDMTSGGGQVYALYDGLLGRTPDPLGFENGIGAIGGESLTALTEQFLGSAEFASRFGNVAQLSNATVIDDLYRTALHRAPDAGGLAFYSAALATGTSRAAVAESIVMSAEHEALLGPAFSAGIAVPDPTAASVARLYYGIFDRAPDTEGLRYWTGQVTAGTPLAAVAAAFLDSTEHVTRFAGQSDTAFVTSIYEGALGRDPDAGGLSFYVGALAAGQSRGAAAANIAESPEGLRHLSTPIEIAHTVV